MAQATPQRSEEFSHLPLSGLRQYRKALTQEESRVSYWRRILQARLDLVRAAETGVVMSPANLRPVLTEAKLGRGRNAIMQIVPDDDIPPLPNLLELWERSPRVDDPDYNADLAGELARAESQLSAYRLALHRRLAAATGELIARYREEPALCLGVLPLKPDRSELRV